ncbi:MAG: hypothetical protein ABI690_02655 [Chloroflexota bacterium]
MALNVINSQENISRIQLLTELAKLGWAEAANRAVELTQSWDYAHEHAQNLAKLAQQGLEASIIRHVERMQSLNAGWERTLMLANLLPFAQNQTDLLRSICSGMLAKLRDLRSEKRESVLYFCDSDAVLTTPMLSQYQLAALSTDVFHVCRDWRWP